MMTVLDISQDDNEVDTSGDDLEENEAKLINLDALVDESGHPLFQQFQTWKRSQWDSRQLSEMTAFKFYLMDCDTWANKEVNPPTALDLQQYDSQLASVRHVIRLHGVNETGHSVCCFVHGFYPYFYAIPSNVFTEEDVSNFKDCLNHAVLHEMKKDAQCVQLVEFFNEGKPPIFQVVLFRDPGSMNIYGFHEPKRSSKGASSSFKSDVVVLKISCLLTKFVWLAAKILKKGIVSFPYVDDPCSYDTFEDTFNPTLRFLTSLNISCCTWLNIQLTPGQYYDRDSRLDPVLRRQTYAQVEFDVTYCKITSLEDPDALPKLRILSFDIECMTRPPKYNMPVKGNDRVLQIGTVLLSTDNEDISFTSLSVKAVFALGNCDPIPDAHVFWFNDEESLLESFRLFVLMTDPDIITGYNINKFDIPFLIERANVLNTNKSLYSGRVKNTPISYRSIANQNKRMNPYADTIPIVHGRVVFDMYPVIKQTFPMESPLTLASVSKKFLEFQDKEDVKYTEIFKLQNLSSITRNRLARYCLQDAWLALQLLLKNPRETEGEGNFVTFYCDKARSSGSPLRYLTTKSNDYDKYFKTVRKQKNPDYVVTPVTPAKRKGQEPDEKKDKVRRALFSETAT